MKRFIIVSGLAFALLVALLVPVSGFAYTDGGYSGKHNGTAFGGMHGVSTLNFRVVSKKHHGKRRHSVQLFGAFTTLDLKCPDDSLKSVNINFVRNGNSYAVKTRVKAKGKFSLSGNYKLYQGSATVSFNGKLSGSGSKSHGAGKLSAKQGTCKSAKVDWTAKRVSK